MRRARRRRRSSASGTTRRRACARSWSASRRAAQPAGRRRRAVFDSRRRRAAARDRRGVPRQRRVSARRRSALARHLRADRAGLRRRAGRPDEVDFVVGTFSKSLGGRRRLLRLGSPELRALHFLARAYVFTASGSPANIASVRAAVRVDPRASGAPRSVVGERPAVPRRAAGARLSHRPDRIADRADLHRRGRSHDRALAGAARAKVST